MTSGLSEVLPEALLKENEKVRLPILGKEKIYRVEVEVSAMLKAGEKDAEMRFTCTSKQANS